jgi:hypothetical protein
MKDEALKKEPQKDGEKKEKQVGKYTYYWCEHRMAWTAPKTANCMLGKQHKEVQKKKPQNANFATVTAAAATEVNPDFGALTATLCQHRTVICDSPLHPPTSNHNLQPHIPCHSNGPNVTPNPGDHNLHDSNMAPPGACLQHLMKASEEMKGQDCRQHEHVPFPFCLCLLQGWLLH